MRIEIYSKDGCYHCEEAMDLVIQLVSDAQFGLLFEQGLAGVTPYHIPNSDIYTYEKYLLDIDFTRNDMLTRFPKSDNYPQILIDDFHVGGLTEFRDYLSDHFYPQFVPGESQ